ncbi:MAG: ATP-binding cassette domain-containing protein [Acidobacteria bacterium]|nr:ATP-binding cassette domain-containing protein [Acidobacteriota bacterium]
MNDVALRVSGLGKQYRLGAPQQRYATLRETLSRSAAAAARAVASPFRRSSKDDGERHFWALCGLSFTVGAGEIVGVIGGNGAGKSTLLKILSRITWPTTGRAEVRGRVGSLLEVGTGFHQELTGRENILLNGAILGMRRVEIARKFDAIVAFAEVERFIDTPVKHYSSGMYLRLAFAVAAHLEPDILLVDEVLAVGDAAFQKKCLGKMEDVARAGRTVLFVSHNMTAVQSLCGRAIWLSGGRLSDDGAPGRVVASYLQSAAVNLTEQVWDTGGEGGSGHDKVRLRRARVRPSGDGSFPITTRTPFQLEFEYLNLQPGAHLNLSVHLYNEQGIMVFNAVPVTERTWQGRPMPRGVFRDTCFIPGDLLNDGVHRVELLVVQDDTNVILRKDEALVFEVHDTPDHRGAWFGDWAGAVRPLFPWTTELLEPSDPAEPTEP